VRAFQAVIEVAPLSCGALCPRNTTFRYEALLRLLTKHCGWPAVLLAGVASSSRCSGARLSRGRSQRTRSRQREVKPSRHPVISFVGILIAVLIAGGAFIILVSQK
jgi:hypothetical protein